MQVCDVRSYSARNLFCELLLFQKVMIVENNFNVCYKGDATKSIFQQIHDSVNPLSSCWTTVTLNDLHYAMIMMVSG